MKKIIITTFSSTYNKGANLQMFALSECFRCLGAETRFLNIKLRTKLNIKGLIWKCVNDFFALCFRRSVGFKYTKRYRSYDELLLAPPSADIYIVGSDQVWNNMLTILTDSRIYYGCYLPYGARKYSYAASFGSNEWYPTKYDDEILKSVMGFQGLSVREASGLQLACELFGRNDIRLDLDPTLLLSSHSLDKLYNPQKTQAIGNYIYCYLLYEDDHIVKILHELLKDNAKEVRGYSGSGIGRIKDICTIRGWLKNIANSDLVITNSFHCLVFAILYKKNFIVLPSYPNREGRMLSLLGIIHQENRYINKIDFMPSLLLEDVDYTAVNEYLKPYRESSMNYLKDMLSE